MAKDEEVESSEVKETVESFNIVEVATQTEPMIQMKDGNLITQLQATVMILNKLDHIESLIG